MLRILAPFGISAVVAAIVSTPLWAEDYKGTIGESKTPPVNYADNEAPHSRRVGAPYATLVPTLKPEVPLHVRPHSRDVMTDIEDRPFFDFNGWQTFVGLIWPAQQQGGQGYVRGLPDMNLTADDFKEIYSVDNFTPGARVAVLETLRTDDDLFTEPEDGQALSMPVAPVDWFADFYQLPQDLSGFSATGTLDEAFSGPLIDQNRRYVRYEVGVNRVFYEFIRDNGYYWKGNLPKSPSPVPIPPLAVPDAWMTTHGDDPSAPLTLKLQPQTQTVVTQRVHGNSITTKTAWRIMVTDPAQPWEQKDDLSRYYTTRAKVLDPSNPDAPPQEVIVGLVGLHVVVRTTQFPQGLWSTFSHVDNLPPIGQKNLPDNRRASFNSDGTVFHPDGYSYQPGNEFPAMDDRQPVEVSRIWKIPNTPVALPQDNGVSYSTQAMNGQFQELLEGTVWQYYQLDITNWPTDPGVFYARPFFQMRGMTNSTSSDMPPALQAIINRNNAAQTNAFPRWAGLPIPQVGALNPILETYFQNSDIPEDTSCIGCHYGASDVGFVWAWRNGVWPQLYKQGRVNPQDTERALIPYVRASDYDNSQ
ncbi:MAG: hypothetical protein WD397_08555 [Wenzhouxiangellaceae bacterium]